MTSNILPNTSDRELLEMAAKAFWDSEIDDVCSIRWLDAEQAIGYTHGDNQDHNGRDVELCWNPITNDGDEARIEAALGLWVRWYPAMVLVGPEVFDHISAVACAEYYDQHNGDKQAARRRAGTRAAAAIGAAK
jgi:hypothetical protein